MVLVSSLTWFVFRVWFAVSFSGLGRFVLRCGVGFAFGSGLWFRVWFRLVLWYGSGFGLGFV